LAASASFSRIDRHGTSRVAKVATVGARSLVDEKLADQLLGRAQAEGAGLVCPAGCPRADTLWR
jgi:hypothetical protein